MEQIILLTLSAVGAVVLLFLFGAAIKEYLDEYGGGE